VNRIRRISTELLAAHRGEFGIDFQNNKKVLDEIAIIRSKGLKNEIAGYITSYLRRELEEQKEKESEAATKTESINETEMEEQILS
jgi:small subunit ribosomal protein S17e